jgi:hypothetical protein
MDRWASAGEGRSLRDCPFVHAAWSYGPSPNNTRLFDRAIVPLFCQQNLHKNSVQQCIARLWRARRFLDGMRTVRYHCGLHSECAPQKHVGKMASMVAPALPP